MLDKSIYKATEKYPDSAKQWRSGYPMLLLSAIMLSPVPGYSQPDRAHVPNTSQLNNSALRNQGDESKKEAPLPIDTMSDTSSHHGASFSKSWKDDQDDAIKLSENAMSELSPSAAYVATTSFNGSGAFSHPGLAAAAMQNPENITVEQAGLGAFVSDPSVEKHGTVSAYLRKVPVSSGTIYSLDLYGDGLVNLVVSETMAKQLARGKGEITTKGITVTLSAAETASIVDKLVKNNGDPSSATALRQ